MNFLSKFIGKTIDNIGKQTRDRMLKKAAERGLPKEFTDRMEKIRKETAEIDALIIKHSKKK